jgi:hygromycin-B 7''-O-kinase
MNYPHRRIFMNDTDNMLPLIHSFEEYEIFKLKVDVLKTATKKITRLHKLSELPLKLFSEDTNIVFEYGENQVIKMFPPFHQGQYQSEWLLLEKFMHNP